jgi:methylated-DNA-protein-cysteine methyltransferase related protein
MVYYITCFNPEQVIGKEGNLMIEEPSSMHNQAAVLKSRIFALVRACPAGRVTTYGWLAKAVGFPRGARMVGWIMNESSPGVPAQRVINSKGELSGGWAFGSPDRMRSLLESEGIVFSDDGKVDLKRYGWDPSRDLDQAQIDAIFKSVDETSDLPSPKLVNLMTHDPSSPFKAKA